MKKTERKLKIMLYSVIETIIDEKKDIVKLLQDLYVSLKDVPIDELRSEFMGKLAEIIHEENKNKIATDDGHE